MNRKNRIEFRGYIWVLFIAFEAGNPSYVEGASKGGSTSPTCGGPSSFSTPMPVRLVVLPKVGTQVFALPNGGAADLGVDLQSILTTVVASSTSFSPLDPNSSPQGPCNSHLELRAVVTTFKLDVAQVGISIGYTPGGTLGPVKEITGKVDTKIGTIAMDFSVWQCVGGVCSAVAASTSNHLTTGVNLSLSIDFGTVNTGSSLIYNTPLGGILRTIMLDGIQQINNSARLNELPWSARVKEYIPEVGSLVFNAGAQARLTANQQFEVYAPTSTTTTGACDVYQRVGIVHTTSVGTVSSSALVDQMTDSRGIQVGDIVMVHQVNSK